MKARIWSNFLSIFVALLSSETWACEDDDWLTPARGPWLEFEKPSLVKRIQPGAAQAEPAPLAPLQWGQLNILSTTDTHGWLAGHLLQSQYSADYGDFSTFVQKMHTIADAKGVDLLLVDSGDLHDGTGLSDSTALDGALSNPIFEKLPYDLLSIGNHELYISDIANDTYHNFAPGWKGKYLTSNVQIYSSNGSLVPLSQKYRHFQTKHGLRIQSFGFLFDFTGNSNISVVTPAIQVVNQTWFVDQIRLQDVDMFLIAGHIPARNRTEWNAIYGAIRQYHPETPIQIFGGHTHIRDFVVFDASATALAAGRYCETVGWVSIDGLNTTNATTPTVSSGTKITPAMVSHIPLSFTGGQNRTYMPSNTTTVGFTRQYLDFNRYTFEYHTNSTEQTFNTSQGFNMTNNITTIRQEQNLTQVIACAPADYYLNRYPSTDNRSILHLFTTDVFEKVIYAPGRQNVSRIMLQNTGGFRFDLYRGPFTLDNAYQLIPFANAWLYKTVPYDEAVSLLGHMQTDKVYKRSAIMDYDTTFNGTNVNTTITDGYVTTDDFSAYYGPGDNTKHNKVSSFTSEHYVQGSQGINQSITPDEVDVYVTSFFSDAASQYLPNNSTDWIMLNFTLFQTFPIYAQQFWSMSC